MRTLCFVVLFGLGAPALAQEAQAPSQPAANADEVVVEGRKPENVYAEIERLEISVYDRFNALNSNDEFDIHCFKQAPTGSNIPLRRCAPNFVVEAEADPVNQPTLIDKRQVLIDELRMNFALELQCQVTTARYERYEVIARLSRAR